MFVCTNPRQAVEQMKKKLLVCLPPWSIALPGQGSGYTEGSANDQQTKFTSLDLEVGRGQIFVATSLCQWKRLR